MRKIQFTGENVENIRKFISVVFKQDAFDHIGIREDGKLFVMASNYRFLLEKGDYLTLKKFGILGIEKTIC